MKALAQTQILAISAGGMGSTGFALIAAGSLLNIASGASNAVSKEAVIATQCITIMGCAFIYAAGYQDGKHYLKGILSDIL